MMLTFRDVAAAVALVLACTGNVSLLSMARAQEADSKSDREAFAAQALGLNMVFFEAQRVGPAPADASTLFPNIWSAAGGWKTPAFTDMCSSVVSTLDPTDAASSDLSSFGGYFEAGTSVVVTGTMAFTAAQRALGALLFMDELEALTAGGGTIRDPAGCLDGGYTITSLKDLYLREMRFAAESLAAAVLVSRADDSEFSLLVGVADKSTFSPAPSWQALPAYQQKCYVADDENPAADIAAQVATALALSAKVARDHGTPADAASANQWETLAQRAYNYAKSQFTALQGAASCSNSPANTNCVGSGCVPTDGTCVLYPNTKTAQQHLFVAAAALQYMTTGSAAEATQFRADADSFWSDTFEPFFFNWNNVAPQGVMILAAAPDVAGATRRQDFYQEVLRRGVKAWETCSTDGQGVFGDGKVFCERTDDGNTYSTDIPQGQLGQALNGVCLAGMAAKLDLLNSAAVPDSTCFMQRQLGYIFNHKCADSADNSDSSCNTPDSEGFSYLVGLGAHFPTKLHSRDAAFPNWGSPAADDGNTMCGAMATGPYLGSISNPVLSNSNPDRYLNNRAFWPESEPGIDFTASMVCALMGYAALPENSFSTCNVRTPFTGRFPVGPNPPGGAAPTLPPPNNVAPPVTPPDECSGLFEQCGGLRWTGAECCVPGATCVVQNQYFSQCEAAPGAPPTPPPAPTPPMPATPPTPATPATNTTTLTDSEPSQPEPTAPDSSGGVAGEWEQCGGATWTGPTECAAGLQCNQQDQWYSQCIPLVEEQ